MSNPLTTSYAETVDGKEVIFHEAKRSDIDLVKNHCADLRSIGAGEGKDDKWCMSAPGWVIIAWCDRHGVSWGDFMRNPELTNRFIEDPDNAAFRIWQGKL
ncbi:hypothetical protein V3390_09195 [Luteimonas sp. FXH3W]|uniref:Uncharacterized protein n=1 Tax=Aquilutibacter rugosus TaxID=3115820 RepID=A0ABU7V226_9GAMM